MNIKGVITPIITILNDDGSIDYDNMKKHINNLIDDGVNGILFFGSLGEFYSFDIETKKKLISFAVKKVNGRVPVLVGIGDTNFTNTLEIATYSADVGVDILVLISPYYFGPTDNSAFEFINNAAKHIKLPIILYNFPDRSGNDLNPNLVLKLAKNNNNIIGIKDTVDNISHTRKMIRKLKSEIPQFKVFSGFDEYYIVNRVSGGDGVISGLTNVEPKLFHDLHQSFESGDFNKLIENGGKISKLMEIYDVTDLFITGIKAAVKVNGLNISTFTNIPSTTITEEQYKKIEDIMKES